MHTMKQKFNNKSGTKNKGDTGRIPPTTKILPGHNNTELSVKEIPIPKNVTKNAQKDRAKNGRW